MTISSISPAICPNQKFQIDGETSNVKMNGTDQWSSIGWGVTALANVNVSANIGIMCPLTVTKFLFISIHLSFVIKADNKISFDF